MNTIQSDHSISVVIPAFNEESNIESVALDTIKILKSLSSRYEVLIMNDASKDHTGEIINGLANTYPGVIRVLHHSVNRGTNLSLIELLRSARYDLIFFLPADKQILPTSIPNYLAAIKQGADIVLGWRCKRKDPFYRAFCNWLYRFILKVFLGISFHDACASDMYKKAVLDKITLESSGRLLQAEIAVKAACLGYTVVEIPVDHYPRVSGKQTGIAPKTAWLSLIDLWRVGIQIKQLKKKHP